MLWDPHAPWNMDRSRHVVIRSCRRTQDDRGISTRLTGRSVSPHSTRQHGHQLAWSLLGLRSTTRVDEQYIAVTL